MSETPRTGQEGFERVHGALGELKSIEEDRVNAEQLPELEAKSAVLFEQLSHLQEALTSGDPKTLEQAANLAEQLARNLKLIAEIKERN